MFEKNSIGRNAVAVAVATALAAGTSTAIAQDDGALEEIIVTATKREASVNDISVSVTALGEEAMRLGGVEDITRLEHLVPGMRMGQSGNEARIAMRGTRTNAVGSEAEQVVGIFEDGVYVPTSTQALGAYIDVQRVEVLRGPQGTLYGRNTFGGTINVITNAPQFDGVTGKVEALFGDYDRTRLEGVVNIPFSDNFAVRIAAMSDKHDGYIENYNEPGTHDDLSDRDMQFARLSARWAPTDTLDVTLRHTWSDLNSNGNAIWGYQIIGSYTNDQFIPGHDFAPDDASDDFDRGPWEVRRNQASNSNHESSSTTLSLNWDIGSVTLDAVLNTTQYDGEQNSDFDYSDGGDPLEVGFSGWRSDQQTDSVELRLSSSGDNTFDWMLGYYWFDLEGGWTWLEFENGVPTVPHWAAQSPYLSDSTAVFANASFNVSDRLRLIGGIRRQEDGKKERDPLDWSVWPPVNNDGAGRSRDWSKTLYKGGIEFDLSDGQLLYGTISTGYRAGGFNPNDPAIPSYYDPEEVTAYEVGLKSTLADGRAQLNLAAYYNDFEEMHAQAFIDLGGEAIAEYFSNGGEIDVFGVEAELNWRPGDNWSVNLNAAYMNAEFGEYLNGILLGFTDLGGRQDVNDPAGGANLKGWSPAMSPEFTLGAQIGYDIEFGNGSVLRPYLQTTYTSDYYASDYNLPAAKQSAHTKSDVRLIWTSADSKLEIQGYVLNLEDEAVLMRIVTFNPTDTHTGLQTHWNNPRTWGVSGTYYFR
ncbi:MAG: TonB-dependent receptor [Gammaproteobacteria bacterium]|jgi:outer membrane receptor protein involved in Fe transport|nr:TonB-dependent receptor [Gammaproteobacteria bacterium]